MKRKRTAEEYIDELALAVYDFLIHRRDKLHMPLPAMSGEVRSFLGRISGRPTAMTDSILRALVEQGKITLESVGGDSLVVLK